MAGARCKLGSLNQAWEVPLLCGGALRQVGCYTLAGGFVRSGPDAVRFQREQQTVNHYLHSDWPSFVVIPEGLHIRETG
jgi:hypothetical protein